MNNRVVTKWAVFFKKKKKKRNVGSFFLLNGQFIFIKNNIKG